MNINKESVCFRKKRDRVHIQGTSCALNTVTLKTLKPPVATVVCSY